VNNVTENAPLSPHEARILVAGQHGDERDLETLAREAGLEVAQARSAIESLKAKGLLELTKEDKSQRAFATDLSRGWAQHGMPEARILAKIGAGEVTIADAQDVPGLEKKATGTAFGWLKQKGYVTVAGGKVKRSDAPAAEIEEAGRAFAALVAAADGLDWATLPEAFRTRFEPKKRGGGDAAVEIRETVARRYRVSAAGRASVGRAAAMNAAPAALTKDMLKSDEWRQVLATTGFRPYAIAAPPIPVVGRREPYREFLDSVKRTLLGLGFEEMTGSLVETEFWDMDALFLPQHHPAREIHDVYFVDDRQGGFAKQQDVGADEAKAIESVAREHEGKGEVSRSRGWGYRFDRERTKRLVLRSQGTVLSARWLGRKDLKNPGKYFAMARCFRYDEVDATHAPDFFQVEGIVVSEKTSFRHLLGLLKLFALEVARANEVKFVPAYFPFTEPSVEIHVQHPTLGWMELGGAGIFRPEVTLPHGVTAPVIAWGLGLDRMAMIALGIKDIRELFTNNVPHGLAAVRERVPR
jgi:phenylalanyl-tRNA synthetase alpha chain